MIILVNGGKRGGKDHCSDIILEKLKKQGKKCRKIAFADAIKDIVAISLSMSVEELNKEKDNETGIYIKDGDNFREITNFRKVLQDFGQTAAKKWFGEMIWVNIVLDAIKTTHDEIVVVSDFRLEIEDIGGITLKIINDTKLVDNHITENSLKDFKFDYYIDNTGMPDLNGQVDNFLEYIK